MASQWPELLAKMRLHTMEPEHWMAELLQAESAERQVRAQANQMKAARFPSIVTCSGSTSRPVR